MSQGPNDAFTHVFLQKIGKGQYTFNEIQLPAEINWWPQTLGWQILAVALWSYLVYRLALRVQWCWRNRYRFEALQELKQSQLLEKHERLLAISQLLKRVALVSHGRQRVAGLNGDAWFRFLDDTADSGFQPLAKRWQNCLYRPDAEPLSAAELEQITRIASHWIRHHRTDAGQNLCNGAKPTVNA